LCLRGVFYGQKDAAVLVWLKRSYKTNLCPASMRGKGDENRHHVVGNVKEGVPFNTKNITTLCVSLW
jgi:hypothetical protein